jgi:hypothetical protein
LAQQHSSLGEAQKADHFPHISALKAAREASLDSHLARNALANRRPLRRPLFVVYLAFCEPVSVCARK